MLFPSHERSQLRNHHLINIQGPLRPRLFPHTIRAFKGKPQSPQAARSLRPMERIDQHADLAFEFVDRSEPRGVHHDDEIPKILQVRRQRGRPGQDTEELDRDGEAAAFGAAPHGQRAVQGFRGIGRHVSLCIESRVWRERFSRPLRQEDLCVDDLRGADVVDDGGGGRGRDADAEGVRAEEGLVRAFGRDPRAGVGGDDGDEVLRRRHLGIVRQHPRVVGVVGSHGGDSVGLGLLYRHFGRLVRD